MKSSIFLSDIHHAYAQTDGTYTFPNSREGDMLKQAKNEIETLRNWLQHIPSTRPDAGVSGRVEGYAADDDVRHVSLNDSIDKRCEILEKALWNSARGRIVLVPIDLYLKMTNTNPNPPR